MHRNAHLPLELDNNIIIGIIAGGDNAIRNSIEGAEDNVRTRMARFAKTTIFLPKDSVISE